METTIQSTRYKYIHEMPCGDSETEGGHETNIFPSILYDSAKDGCNRLLGKVALIEGGDTGLGRAIAVQFAKEGAEVAILFNDDGSHARETAGMIREYGKQALLLSCDVTREDGCKLAVDRTISKFGKIDILVNNAAQENIVPQYYLVNHAIPHLAAGSSIINTSTHIPHLAAGNSITNTSTQDAIIDFTRALSSLLIKKGIRVNAVAPGAMWNEAMSIWNEVKDGTELPLDSINDFGKIHDFRKIHNFGRDSLMGYAAHPADIAPCYIFLASEDAAFISGEVLHPNGGTVMTS
ncbi:SDR family oxidoreductase [Chitinophaga silvisoli]|uniref:SDR family NAD(P)-dependent oxidoreductase n=1 Tax=Chitinophaga silvisoli TaxID=2291814 RepID=A0A3E1NYI4_9BACT|nr:SDR family oxidoreductase [Chitinophaga silvisoli]RFM32972.1 SDR family NAD(P)-dependent oxidoreductase [Chitinophaga silvisoli]